MLRNISDLYGTPLAATDGAIGHVRDFYFDDATWAVRYLIVDTGSWLTGRQVLLSPHAFDGFSPDGEDLKVKLTRAQIENSPFIETHRPVTRQHEKEYYQHYNWLPYWKAGEIGGMPLLTPPVEIEDDIHLRSTRALKGYDIKAIDGTLGTVSGFLVDHISWSIADLAVETGHWYSGKQILISPVAVLGISYADSEVSVKLTRADIARTHKNEVATQASNYS